MGTKKMPATAKCQKCLRIYPVKAAMTVDGKSIPMLVVLQEVDDAQAALEAVTCQVCLGNQGDPQRGLLAILKGFGYQDIQTPTLTLATPSRGHSGQKPVIAPSRDRSGQGPVIAAPSRGRAGQKPVMAAPSRGHSGQKPVMAAPGPKRSGPSLAGMQIKIPGQGCGRDDQSRGSNSARDQRLMRERINRNACQLPKPLREPERAPRPPKVKHLTGDIGERNRAALQDAMVVARERDAQRAVEAAAKKAERDEQFKRVMWHLSMILGQIRTRATTQDVSKMISRFLDKVREAGKLSDPQRSVNALLTDLRASREQLHELERLPYTEMVVEPFKGRHGVSDTRLTPRDKHPNKERQRLAPREIVQIDAFEGTSRPEHWDAKRGGVRVGFYALTVVRCRVSLPEPNPDPYDGSKISYPEGGEYGPEYTIHNDGSTIGRLVSALMNCFEAWLNEHREAFDEPTDIHWEELIPVFFQDLAERSTIEDEDVIEEEELMTELDDDLVTGSPTPATTP